MGVLDGVAGSGTKERQLVVGRVGVGLLAVRWIVGRGLSWEKVSRRIQIRVVGLGV